MADIWQPLAKRCPSEQTDRIASMAEGTIKKLTDKGFGFINTNGPKDLFFHSKSLQGVRFEELHEGQRVSYTEGQGPKGPCAENVKLA
jgi:cold shock protein